MGGKKTTDKETAKKPSGGGFTAEERAAMRERAREAKAAAGRAEGEKALREAIAKLPEPDHSMGARLHEIVTEVAPELVPRTWYGMPAYAKDDKVVCFFQPASKFKSRYATFGFNDSAKLDEGTMWPTAFALTELTEEAEVRIARLVKKAVGR